jgi:methyl-accepting chemotaxis protein
MQPLPQELCAPCTNSLLSQLASIASILTFTSFLLLSLLLYIRNAQQRKLQIRKMHVECNAHVAGMQEITWAIAAVKESIKTTDDGSDEAREVFDSVSRLLRASEEELDQLARRTEGVGSVLEKKRGWGMRMRFWSCV